MCYWKKVTLTRRHLADGVTVKYVYGPATASTSSDAVIGSSLWGRLESGIGLFRLTTISMPMKGTVSS
jgi:hypothetical protein